MSLREMMIHSIVQFEFASGHPVQTNLFDKLSDEEILKLYRKNVWDDGYTDGHVDGYFQGMDQERELSKHVNTMARLN